MVGADKTKCRKCSSEVKNGDIICCRICNVWHHLHCSGLSRENSCNILEIKISSGNVPNVLFIGAAKTQEYLVNVVAFSVTVLTNGFIKGVRSLLDNDKFVKLGQCEKPWFCLKCMTNNLPCYVFDEKKS